MDSFDEKSTGSQVFTIMGDNMSIMAGFLVLMVMVANVMGKDFKASPLLPVANCLNLFTFQDWSTFFIDETDQIIYSSAVTSEMVLWAVIPSIVIGAIIVLLSYVFFKHDDLN